MKTWVLLFLRYFLVLMMKPFKPLLLTIACQLLLLSLKVSLACIHLYFNAYMHVLYVFFSHNPPIQDFHTDLPPISHYCYHKEFVSTFKPYLLTLFYVSI